MLPNQNQMQNAQMNQLRNNLGSYTGPVGGANPTNQVGFGNDMMTRGGGLQGLLGSMQGMAPGMVNGGVGGLLSPNFGNWGRQRQMNYLQGQAPNSPFQRGQMSPQMMRQLMGGLLGGRQMIAPVGPSPQLGAPMGVIPGANMNQIRNQVMNNPSQPIY